MRNYNRITPEGTKDLLLEECLLIINLLSLPA